MDRSDFTPITPMQIDRGRIVEFCSYDATMTVHATLIQQELGTWNVSFERTSVCETILAQLNSDSEFMYIPRSDSTFMNISRRKKLDK